jgi:threonylcarbamoyladenosine tRNA methylthiotransferase MtaB
MNLLSTKTSAKLKTVTLGCKVNQYETQYVREGLLGIGFEDATESQPADLCIVNTCTVTHEGDAKSRQVIRRLHRENPDARIVVMGCFATREPEAVAALPGVAEVITDKRELPDLLGRFGVIDLPNGISGLSNRHRAYVKVQDGCLLRCSYCIIPTVRPNMSSRPQADILQEIWRLKDNGFREVVLTGIHLGHYGVDLNAGKPKPQWTRLAGLVREICQSVPGIRVRLSSIEATEVTHELLDVMQEFSDWVCPHLHVCLQSGSDRVLRAMKRRWTRRHIIDRCQLVKERLHLPALTTDVIVGFPGESDADFEATLDACRQIGFSKIHVFPFSPRRGTPAADLPHQIGKELKTQRSAVLATLDQQLRQDYFTRLIGEDLQMLVERNDGGWATGTSCRYAQARCCDTTAAENELVSVRVVEASVNQVFCRPIDVS